MIRWSFYKKNVGGKWNEDLKEHIDVLYFRPSIKFGEGCPYKTKKDALAVWLNKLE